MVLAVPKTKTKLYGDRSLAALSGFEINEKIQSQFRDRIPKFSRNLATLSRRIFALHFLVSGLAKQNMSLKYLCSKKPLKMAKNA